MTYQENLTLLDGLANGSRVVCVQKEEEEIARAGFCSGTYCTTLPLHKPMPCVYTRDMMVCMGLSPPQAPSESSPRDFFSC
jgi:hypothetical protein